MDVENNDESSEIELAQSISVRGVAICQVVSGAVLCEGFKFGTGHEFPIFSPASHHAVELRPIGIDVRLRFRRSPPLDIDPGERLRLFPPTDWTKVQDIIVEGLSKSGESGFCQPRQLSHVLTKISSKTRLAVIGGKSSGKSSANRFILNHLLNSGFSKVYWFELDPGQPEFNISGWMALTEVTSPRVGPNFAFLRAENFFKPIASAFCAELSPGNNPAQYMRCVRHLKKALDRLDPGVPVIFNAMGWLRHLGLKLLLDVVRLCRIDLVYYLKTSTSNDLPDDLQPSRLMDQSGFRENRDSNNDRLVSIVEDESVSNSAVKKRKSESTSSREWHPKTLRDIATSLFFTPWSNSENLLWVEFRNLGLNFYGGVPANVFQILNNSVVSLSRVNHLPPEDSFGFRTFSDLEDGISSFGFGWVRHVDMEALKINIHTSLPVGELIELGVNCLVIGHIPLPGQFAAKRADVAHIPYVHVRDEENVTANQYKATHQMKKRPKIV